MTRRNPSHAPRSAELPDLEEAARYALLQRLAPALQHQMMGKLQSVDLLVAMMEHRLDSANPDLAGIREDCASLRGVSSMVMDSIINIMTWVDPGTASALTCEAGVRECLGLLTTELRFKGFVIVNEVREIDVALSGRALRGVLSATLIALSDLAKAPAQLIIGAQAMADRVELSIDRHPVEGEARGAHMTTDHRPLTWRDVEIIAMAESVTLTHGDDGARLTFPRVEAGANAGSPCVIETRH